MRKDFIKIAIALALPLSASCSEDPFPGAEEFNGEYAGLYRLVSATFDTPIDFNGGGNVTADIVEGLEMDSYDLRQVSTSVSEENPYREPGISELCIEIPAQKTNTIGGKLTLERPRFVIFPVYFNYTVDRGGEIRVAGRGDFTKVFSELQDVYNETYNPQVLKCGDASVESFGGGELTVKVKMCYVDMRDGQWVIDYAHFKYRRDIE